jgi:hypothetical protein
VVSQKAVADLPLNGRNFSQLLALTPGVSPVSVSQNATGPLRSVGTVVMPSVNGQTGRSNIFLLDGVVNFGANQNYYIVTPIVETIQEFKVQAHNDLAEFGGGLGERFLLLFALSIPIAEECKAVGSGARPRMAWS